MSVRKNGNTWSFRIDVGKNHETGKRLQKYKSGFPTKKAAELAKAELITTVKKEGYLTPSNVTFKQLIIDWLETVHKIEVQPTTYEKTLGIVRNRIIPSFRFALVQDIKSFDLQQFLTKLLKEGLSPAYVKTIHNILSKAFRTAIDWELISKNPIQGVKSPSIKKSNKKIWNTNEIKMFLDTCTELRWKVAFTLAISTGIRRGELLALKWSKVDFKEKTILINESLACTKELGLFFKEPKTKSSIRKILLPESVINLLIQLKIEQDRVKLSLGAKYHLNDLVISTYDGKPIHPRNLARKFKQLIGKTDLKEINIHGMRHSNATLLMKQNVNPKIVSERLGHSNVGITLDFYSHTDLEIQKRATESLNTLFSSHIECKDL